MVFLYRLRSLWWFLWREQDQRDEAELRAIAESPEDLEALRTYRSDLRRAVLEELQKEQRSKIP